MESLKKQYRQAYLNSMQYARIDLFNKGWSDEDLDKNKIVIETNSLINKIKNYGKKVEKCQGSKKSVVGKY